jgi:hypothetical protein
MFGRFCCPGLAGPAQLIEVPCSENRRFLCPWRRARNIVAGDGRSFQNSTRNTPGNRNRHNVPRISDLIFSTRNKTGGVAGLWPRRSHRGGRLGLSRNLSAVAGLLREGGSRISNRKTLGNRNRRNSPINNQIHFSNRKKIGGLPDYVAACPSWRARITFYGSPADVPGIAKPI